MLYLATFKWLDGEHEYLTRHFVEGESLIEANHKVAYHLATMWDSEPQDSDDGFWFVSPEGYPAVMQSGMQEVTTLEDVVNAIGTIS